MKHDERMSGVRKVVRKIILSLACAVGGIIVLLLAMPLLMSGVLIALGTMSGCYEESAPEEVVSKLINCEDRQFDWLKEYIPVESTDIKARRKQGDLLGGALIRIRCHVEPDAMRRFIEKGTFRYRFDSTMTNANPRYQQAVLEIPNWSGDFWENSSFPKRGGEFWSYNYIYDNNGGYRCYYDLTNKVFYYEWSSN